MSLNDDVELSTGRWFNVNRSTKIAHGFGFIIWRSETGHFVAQAREFGDYPFWELAESTGFNSLMRHNKAHIPGEMFAQMYTAYLKQGQR